MEIYKNLSIENLEGEEWLQVVGYENYQVSSYGRIKSLKDNHNNTREKILSQCECNNGYLKVILCKDGKRKTCSVHRLVGNAFLENPNNLPCFNHKNEIKTDNRAENLEPCTQKYNVNYGTAIQRRAEKQINDPNKSKKVFQYTKNGTLVAIWESVNEAGRNGFDNSNVSACCRGELKHYKGYLWSYTEINPI